MDYGVQVDVDDVVLTIVQAQFVENLPGEWTVVEDVPDEITAQLPEVLVRRALKLVSGELVVDQAPLVENEIETLEDKAADAWLKYVALRNIGRAAASKRWFTIYEGLMKQLRALEAV